MAKKRIAKKKASQEAKLTPQYKHGEIIYLDRNKFGKIVLGALTEVDGVKGRVVYTGGEQIKFEVE